MAHSIELLLDAHSDGVIRAAWQALADAGLPSQMNVKSATNRPHITLLAAERISPDVDEVLNELAPRLPLACVVGAHLVFGRPVFGRPVFGRPVLGGPVLGGPVLDGSSLTLARLIVPSAELLALHAAVYRLTMPFVTGQPFPHCRPGHWTAHATLGRRLTPVQVGAALALAPEVAPEVAPGLTAPDLTAPDLTAEVVGLRRWDSDARTDHLLID
jgi:hypothetical protein